MTINPFTFDLKKYEIDPDDAIEELNQWFETFMPVYYGSEEFRQLSKANQKSGGQMFHMFMELNLNYLGNNLAQVNKEAASSNSRPLSKAPSYQALERDKKICNRTIERLFLTLCCMI
ncbi:hypothetical protein GZ77_08585 [Endozoicomonas montiporae]|uniref:Uncharacterized protein n=2 Tax=Endozoicomonas montiporae TaxID=1027273 RepID=A0A081N7J8_9GAMM|nr:hypothetical protein [Endozoicomonas montiporae]AMO55737.1 hypothetical protein EZMO1_1577 [Endozoicomonas montiporae CL-33]KEQ14421.1 hypothetical protein GZ77_08585 [Endozoicomonas montiporae]